VETKIVLAVRGVDLRDDKTVSILNDQFPEVGWLAVGELVQAVIYTESSFPVGVAVALAQLIRAILPDAEVPRADEELVTIGNIADAVGVTHETVRLWVAGQRRATGQPFPAPRASINAGRAAMNVWAWADVVQWLRVACGLDPEPEVMFLSDREVAELNLQLATRARSRRRWLPVGEATDQMLDEVDAAASPTAEGSFGAPRRFMANAE
jgi:hypothetical protein